MKMRRFLSVLLAVAMVMSILSIGIVATSAADTDTADTAADIDAAAAGSAYSDMQSKVTADNQYGLSATVNEGTILQAWNWSFANIEANLETVAAQGFTTIQVSPPNEIKKGTKGAKVLQSDNQNGWWMFYQPAGFQLNQSTDNALGTKAEFVSMCNKAHQLGMKVIVDAVINHMGTKEGDDNNTSTDPMSHVTPRAQTFEPEIYNNKLFHTPWKQMQYIESNNTYYNSAYDLTRNCTSGLPDLKTEDTRVQNAIYDYMEELVQAGADGFRFDAAKHIETPDDHDGLGSAFWTNTLKKVQSQHPDKEIYAYGEILNTCGIDRPYSWYTKLFDVTDSGSYWSIFNAVKNGGTGGTPYYPTNNFTSQNTVLWDESHDTYCDGASDSSKGTMNLTTVQRGKIWALVAGRKDISCVYFARPSDDTNGGAMYSISIGDAKKTAWSNSTTKAINQFHNYYIGQSEYCTANSGGTAYIERGTTGVMIVNLGGTTSKSVSLKANKLAAGDYIDAITGNKFTVSGGYIKGQVGNTGVAVVYENSAAPEPTDPPETYVLGDADLSGTVDSVDATMIMRYSIDLATLTEKQKLAADVDGDGYVTVIDATLIQRYVAHMTVRYDIGQTKEVGPVKPTTPYVNPTNPYVNPTNPYVDPTTPVQKDSFLLTDNFNWGSAFVYAWDAEGNALCGEWPGSAQAETVTNDFGETQFRCYVPAGAAGVILNNGNGAQTEDITDFSYDGYWMDGTKNDLGHYKVTGFFIENPPVDPTQPVNPPVDPTQPVVSNTSFLLTDNFNWGSAYVYAWDAEGNALCGEWPGSSQAETVTNDFGETQFRCYVPDGAAGVILNNGNGAQTEDITDFSYDGYWMDGTKNDLGHYKVTGFFLDNPVIDPPVDPTQPYTPPVDPPVGGDGGTIVFSNNKGFSTVNIYYWADGQDGPVEWPGVPMTSIGLNDFGEERFTFTMPEGMTNYIINDGSQQTVDIPFTGSTGVYMTDKDAAGHYMVDFYALDGTESGGDNGGNNGGDNSGNNGGDNGGNNGGNTGSVSFLLTDNFNWGSAYVYAWDAEGNALCGEWPGSAQAETVTNDFGETQFRCYVPDGAAGVILNNGNGAQTEDITDFGTYTGYWMDGTKNDLGHYKVTGWN